jgi:hypothetical protein
MRERPGIPRPGGGRWTAEALALLGTLPDRELARRLGRSLSSVTQKRCKLGIAGLRFVSAGAAGRDAVDGG